MGSSLWLDGTATPTDPRSTLGGQKNWDDIVIGAGITGMLTAVLLARAGREVLVLEGRTVGAVTTGNTTAKVSVLQGTMLSQIRSQHSQKLTEAYLEANQEGLNWLIRYCSDHDVPLQRRDAVTYVASPDAVSSIDKEYRVARSLGLPVHRGLDEDVPFPVADAVRLPEQAQLDPLELLQALTSDVRARGATVVTGTRVVGVRAHPLRGGCQVRTADGTELNAENVILATGVPFLDRGLYFAKVEPHRSYALSFELPADAPALPQGMYLSSDEPTRTYRTAQWLGEERIVVGGHDHVVGRHPSPASLVAELEEWTQRYFPKAERTHAWSAQDYRSMNLIPFVGWLPRGNGHIFLATGYNKWGFTNSAAAALRISADILGGHLPWAKVIGRRITVPSDIARAAQSGFSVGVEATKAWLSTQLGKNPTRPPQEGEGQVGRAGGQPVAVSRTEGRTCAVSAVCTHMGGIVTWNDQERSWDCPLHGSRFSADGAVLEGPAVRPLNTHVRKTGRARRTDSSH